MFGRRNVAAYAAEFLGTGVLTLLILSVQRSTIGIPFFVALAAGLAVMVMSFAVAAVSGGYFNPALTLAMWTVRQLSTVRAVAYIVAQILGAWGAYYLYTYFVKNTLQPVGGKYDAHILTAEIVGTAIFAFGWAGIYFQRFTAGVAASVTGLAYTVGIIAASSAAIGLLNPAVALGVKAWVWNTYVLGPVVGALIGVNLYKYVFDIPAVAASATATAAPVPAATKKSVTATAKKKPARKKK